MPRMRVWFCILSSSDPTGYTFEAYIQNYRVKNGKGNLGLPCSKSCLTELQLGRSPNLHWYPSPHLLGVEKDICHPQPLKLPSSFDSILARLRLECSTELLCPGEFLCKGKLLQKLLVRMRQLLQSPHVHINADDE